MARRCLLEETIRLQCMKAMRLIFCFDAGSRAPAPEIKFVGETPATINNPALMKQLIPAFREAVGNENVFETEPMMPSEDFCQYSVLGKLPAAILWLGVTPKPGPNVPFNHSPQFVADFKPGFRSGVKGMVASVIAQSKTD